jgi:hypothetical protein
VAKQVVESNEQQNKTDTDTLTIPREQWVTFLDNFTRENRGAHARLEVIATGLGAQVEAEDKPLEGVSADVTQGESNVWITFASTPSDHVAHRIPNATGIRAIPPQGRSGAVLEIEARDGSRTLLELSRPEEFELPPPENK